MNSSNQYPNVTFYEEDRNKGPFKIRISGTSDFVSKINTHLSSHHPEKIEVINNWENPKVLLYDNMQTAIQAASQVYITTGLHTSIEIHTTY